MSGTVGVERIFPIESPAIDSIEVNKVGMLCNILVNSLRKKHCLVGIIRTKMYLCHSENLMPKDTKSLGNNKAPACESRGFVLKKKKVRILTHLSVHAGLYYSVNGHSRCSTDHFRR